MPIVIPSGSTPTAAMESLVLDGLALNDESIFVLEAFAFNPAPKRQRWIQGEDADGSALAEPSRSENATATMTLRVVPQGTMDSALAQIGKIADKLYEAEQQPDGIPLVWTPATGTKVATAYVLSGEITDLPFTPEAGYWVYAPLLTVRFDCKPFMDGAEILNFVPAATNSNPIQTITLPAVPGDVPAKARLVVTDAATQSRRHLEWGLQWRYYDAATSLQINSASLVTSGFTGTSTTRTGSYNTNVVRGSLLTTTTTLAGLGNLGHVGTFRVKARIFPSIATTTASDLKLRLTWQEGYGPLSSNAWVSSPVGTSVWTEVDLGMISIPPATLGTQRWTGQIDAYSSTAADTLDIDYLILIPAGEGYGKARGTLAAGVLTVNGYDEFTGTTAGAGLDTRTAPSGGTWATSIGTTTGDYLFVDGPGAGEETISRATTSDTGLGRYAILGSSTFTDMEVGVRFRFSAKVIGPLLALLARYVDSTDYIRASYQPGTGQFTLQVTPGGSVAVTAPSMSVNTWYRMRLIAYSTGALVAVLMTDDGAVLTQVSSEGVGALTSGKPGIFDSNGGVNACSRFYDSFYVGLPAQDQRVVYPGRSAEIRSDSAIRQDSTGTYYGPIPSHHGAHFFVPPAGDENRTSRALVKTRRNDIDNAVDNNVTDATTVAVHLTPRYSTVPR